MQQHSSTHEGNFRNIFHMLPIMIQINKCVSTKDLSIELFRSIKVPSQRSVETSGNKQVKEQMHMMHNMHETLPMHVLHKPPTTQA